MTNFEPQTSNIELKTMTTETLSVTLTHTTASLLKMAREMTWNTISDDVRYVIRITNDVSEEGNVLEQNRMRKRILDAAPELSIEQAATFLLEQYPNLYCIDLYIFMAFRNRTIVEIQLLEKSRLGEAYRLTVSDKPPEWHAKVLIPPYRGEAHEKFDINWPVGSWEHRWKMFWWKRKMKHDMGKR